MQRRHLWRTAAPFVTLAALLGACTAPTNVPPSPPSTLSAATNFALTSNAFAEGAIIPQKFTCAGAGTSPQLGWSGAPTATQSFALIMDDPDAPGGTFTHWVAFDIPATQSEITEGAQGLGTGGKNGRGQTGYTGPCPPSGTHRYFFTLYALDLQTLGLNDGAARADVEKAMAGHILSQSQLMGRVAR